MTAANLSLFRQNIVDRIAAAQEAKREAQQQEVCVHEWKEFRQTVRTDNPNFTGSAYFVVKACLKCHIKEIMNYITKR